MKYCPPIKVKNLLASQRWCEQHISPRQYVLHNAIGGEGWKLTYSRERGTLRGLTPTEHYSWKLTIDDEAYITFYLLSGL